MISHFRYLKKLIINVRIPLHIQTANLPSLQTPLDSLRTLPAAHAIAKTCESVAALASLLVVLLISISFFLNQFAMLFALRGSLGRPEFRVYFCLIVLVLTILL